MTTRTIKTAADIHALTDDADLVAFACDGDADPSLREYASELAALRKRWDEIGAEAEACARCGELHTPEDDTGLCGLCLELAAGITDACIGLLTPAAIAAALAGYPVALSCVRREAAAMGVRAVVVEAERGGYCCKDHGADSVAISSGDTRLVVSERGVALIRHDDDE